MPFHQADALRYYTFDLFAEAPLTQAVFTRHGGASPAPWGALNVGLTVGDHPANVTENRRRSFAAVGRSIETLSDSWLVHGKAVLVYDAPRPTDQHSPPKADIILTDNPEVTLFMRYADCVPLLFYDPQHNAIALAHSGWQGTVQRVGAAAVAAMQARYGSDPTELLAVVGPAIGPAAYQVGPNVIARVHQAFGEDANALLPAYNGSTHFDLWAANRLVLAQAGVRQIEVAELCTATHVDDWFSHRAEKGQTGRFGVLLALNA